MSSAYCEHTHKFWESPLIFFEWVRDAPSAPNNYHCVCILCQYPNRDMKRQLSEVSVGIWVTQWLMQLWIISRRGLHKFLVSRVADTRTLRYLSEWKKPVGDTLSFIIVRPSIIYANLCDHLHEDLTSHGTSWKHSLGLQETPYLPCSRSTKHADFSMIYYLQLWNEEYCEHTIIHHWPHPDSKNSEMEVHKISWVQKSP